MAAQQLYFTGTPKSQKLHRWQKRAGRQVVSWLCSLRTRGEAGFERSPSSRKLARHRFLSPNPPVQRRYYKTRHSQVYRLCRRSIRSVYGSLTSELLRRRLRTTTAAATTTFYHTTGFVNGLHTVTLLGQLRISHLSLALQFFDHLLCRRESQFCLVI